MQLTSLFAKQVDRKIEGVIKADDNASLQQEVEEYVLTNEVAKRLEAFLDAYTSYQGANGVWISGFFGSGKSHLLKMLAMLLENATLGDQTVPALFERKPEVAQNEILKADLRRAAAIPSRSILFNIDQKADVISKTQIDALLAVFVKVFDEMCGYYGKQGHIAQFERDLDSRELFDTFKTAYESIAGLPWERGREQAILEGENIAKAYAQVTGGNPKNADDILDKYRSEYRVSIEDFAGQVKAYIDRQPPGFRLNFFVDEVGQYIAYNVKLMTNLQTIAESLATKCRGQAWVVVTAQEEMDSVIGELGKQGTADFSKIQDRFSNRLKLTSANVAEVIQKRLLHKNEQGVDALSELFHAQSNNFKTLFDFADGAASYRNFRDRDHFIHCYPFIPYQFELFQASIQNLSAHNAFEGKHSSVGERSMLGVFQQVAIQIGQHEVGQLATFDLMFEGIRTALKTQIQRAVIQAEKQLDNTFAIRVLKALFLVKYVNEFNATVRNLCVLMLESFDQDLPKLRRRVEEALALLEQQTFIQRNGETYEYLTDEEKDVEEAIKNTDVETSDVADELEKLLFDHSLGVRKIRYDETGQDYAFTRKLDERLHGREMELCIHVISPFHEHTGNKTLLQMQNTGKDELMVVLPPDDRLVRDLLMYKRTEKYIRQTISVTQRDSVKRILTDRGFQNQERHGGLKKRVKELLGKATLLVAGSEVDIGGEDGASRVVRGFHELVTRVYPNLRMLRNHNYKEEDVGKILRQAEGSLFSGDVTQLEESEQEVLAHIQSNHRGGVRTTLKILIERFERKPYGWSYPAILCQVAKLCVRGKVELRSDGNLLEDNALESALRNTHGQGNVVLDPQVEFTQSQVRALKEFHSDFFDSPPQSGEAKALGKETGDAFAKLVQTLELHHARADRYPFLNALVPILAQLKELCGKPYTWYLTEFRNHEDELLDAKENLITPISNFMGGSQRAIYDAAREFAREQEANLKYLDDESGPSTHVGEPGETPPGFDALKIALADPACYRGPKMKEVKTLLGTLEEKVTQRLGQEIQQAVQSVESLRLRLAGMDEYAALSEGQRGELNRPFEELKRELDQQTLIAMVRDSLRRFEDQEYQNLLARMANWAAAAANPVPETPGESQPAPPQIESIPLRKLNVPYEKVWISTEADVEAYLTQLRATLLREVKEGKRVQV
jgi:energy-coupling factor transporter ATP-binding protein EcfA2